MLYQAHDVVAEPDEKDDTHKKVEKRKTYLSWISSFSRGWRGSWHEGSLRRFIHALSITAGLGDYYIGLKMVDSKRVLSGEKPFSPDGRANKRLLSGEKPVWPDGNTPRVKLGLFQYKNPNIHSGT